MMSHARLANTIHVLALRAIVIYNKELEDVAFRLSSCLISWGPPLLNQGLGSVSCQLTKHSPSFLLCALPGDVAISLYMSYV